MRDAEVNSCSIINDYLVDKGLISDDIKTGYVLVENPRVCDIPLDNSVTLTAYWVHPHSSYFTWGEDYSIGTNGKRNSKYFRCAIQCMCHAYKLDGSGGDIRLTGYAEYFEDHTLWIHLENTELHYYIPDPLMVFRLS